MSNLTVSYVSQTPAGTPAGTSAAAPAADSPLGFLAALVDQLLAGGAEAAATSTESGAGINVPGILNAAFSNVTETTAQKPGLLETLVAGLDALQSGDGSADLNSLGESVDAVLSALSDDQPANAQINRLVADLGLKAGPTDLSALHDRLTALSQSMAATAPDLAQKFGTLAAKLEPVATGSVTQDSDAHTIANILRTLLGNDTDTEPTDAGGADTKPQAGDELLQVLASLGLSTTTPVASTDTSATTDSSVTVPQPLLRLSNQLSQVAAEIKAKSPEMVAKLDAVATSLVSADADPDLLAKLTGAAADADGAKLDKLVQSLIDAKPSTSTTTAAVSAAPQIAVPSDLAIPAPIAPKQPKSAVTDAKAAPPETASVTADSAQPSSPRLNLSAAHETRPDPAPEPKIEAKAAVVADAAAKSDADPALQQAQAQPQAAPAATQQARPLPAAYQPVANPINMGQVAFEMVRQVHQGSSRFTLRLDPPELGRVDVKMHVDSTGTVNARLTVDRAETLDLFQRDRQSLERALSQAGLDAGKTNLEFSLRQQNQNPFAGMMGGDQRQQQPNYGGGSRFGLASNDEATAVPAITLYRGIASAGGVNIFA